MFDLTGKTAVVTGGTSGIGLGIAKGFVRAGARVALVGRDESRGRAALESLGSKGAGLYVQADITDHDQCLRVIQEAEAHFGSVNILVNNAGMNIRRNVEEYTQAQWYQIIDTNLSSAFYCAQAVRDAFVRANGGKILNIGSMLSLFGTTYAAGYAASKGGIVQLGRALAVEWAGLNVQVNTLLPGWIETELTAEAKLLFPDLEAGILSRTPQARWGRPDDLAGIAVALCSRECDFITGVAIPVDGGYSVQG
ncbi:SDR family NAD(P)-dependent oxidoreductase [Paraburkholderia haematera]|uniref:2-dehydro-3-deoxy-D-gluconate 5-dehydrogenase n=1 Tax=Paraburkholderia haematera TaxID=2793077 RepID=A0ABM8SCY4_9BURK|nr:SDR family oxidoreductase [Paraburkholderia haematera]CAE6801810.1 2-dehydro-3-deoxy-D-gluconate 5-dehydrogenase [Paraburkholderia haematera]